MSPYVPIVKAKLNDTQAIVLMSERERSSIKPLFELPISIENKQASTDASKAVALLSKRLPDMPFYFDPLNFEAEFRQISSINNLAQIGKKVTPVFGLDRLPDDVVALRQVLHSYGLKFGIRLELRDISQPEEAWAKVLEYSGRLELSQDSVELLLDLQYLQPSRLRLTREAVLDFFLLQPKRFTPGASTLIGSSALGTVAGVDIDGDARIERLERELWAWINYELGGTRTIGFGDYGIVNPTFAFSGPNPNANAKVRYTQGAVHHVFRGHGLYNPSRFDQYHELARRVVSSGCFMGAEFSYGDSYIAACAAGDNGPGNLGTWVKVDMNHHLEVVARQTQNILRELTQVSSARDLKDLLVTE